MKNIYNLLIQIRKRINYIIPFYFGFLTYLLLKPISKNEQEFLLFPHFDKIIHFVLFSILGFLLGLKLREKQLLVILIVFVYGGITELLQENMKYGRSGDFLDLFFDFSGGVVGYYFLKFILKK